MKEQVKIKVIRSDGKEHVIWTLVGKRLWDSLAASGFDAGGVCAGNGTCGKCKVRVEGDSGAVSEQERKKLLPEELRAGIRLACYCTVHAPLTVHINYDDHPGESKNIPVYADYLRQDDPMLLSKQLYIPGLDPDNPVPLHRRLREALGDYRLELSADNLSDLFRLDREGRPALELNAIVYPSSRIKYIGPKQSRAFGIALDLGTTTIFAALLDLQMKEVKAMVSKSNMQRTYGADIISRISYSLANPEGVKTLQQVLINSVNTCIEELIRENDILPEEIYAFSAAGNPVMLHYFMGLNPSGFACVPYSGIFADEICYGAKDLGLIAAEGAECYILPQIGGFIGADTIACLLALPDEKEQNHLMVDIGTNGEIVLCKQGQMWAASAAAGPAFEGGEISCGMRAGEGAVDRIYLNSNDQMEFNVLGNKGFRGLCGSAIIDLIACLLKTRGIDNNGIIIRDNLNQHRVDSSFRGDQIILQEGSETGTGMPVFIDQEDIRQVQLAKAAIRAAIDILLMEADMKYQDIDCIYLAGAFGNYINPSNAVHIGMLPPVEMQNIKSAGNAAGQGVIKALLSSSAWEQAKELKKQVHYVELAGRADFQDIFLNNLNFNLYEDID